MQTLKHQYASQLLRHDVAEGGRVAPPSYSARPQKHAEQQRCHLLNEVRKVTNSILATLLYKNPALKPFSSFEKCKLTSPASLLRTPIVLAICAVSPVTNYPCFGSGTHTMWGRSPFSRDNPTSNDLYIRHMHRGIMVYRRFVDLITTKGHIQHSSMERTRDYKIIHEVDDEELEASTRSRRADR